MKMYLTWPLGVCSGCKPFQLMWIFDVGNTARGDRYSYVCLFWCLDLYHFIREITWSHKVNATKHARKKAHTHTHIHTYTHKHTAVLCRILGICSQEGRCGSLSALFLSIFFSFPLTLEVNVFKILKRFSFSIWCFKEIENWYNAVFLTATNLWLNDCWRCWSGLRMDC